MLSNRLSFHHFGLAVSDPTRAVEFLQSLGYRCGEVITDREQNVNLILCRHETDPDVEIIFRTRSSGPLESILKKTKERIYHICYETDDIETAVGELEARGLRVLCVSPKKPAILFSNRIVSFHYVEGFGLIELLEKES